MQPPTRWLIALTALADYESAMEKVKRRRHAYYADPARPEFDHVNAFLSSTPLALQ